MPRLSQKDEPEAITFSEAGGFRFTRTGPAARATQIRCQPGANCQPATVTEKKSTSEFPKLMG
jgi:hypothetical protein